MMVWISCCWVAANLLKAVQTLEASALFSFPRPLAAEAWDLAWPIMFWKAPRKPLMLLESGALDSWLVAWPMNEEASVRPLKPEAMLAADLEEP